MRALLCFVFLSASSYAANPVIFGGRGGTALNTTNNLIGNVTSNITGPGFTVGPTLGIRLPLNFSIEGDALYNRRSLGLGLSGLTGFKTHSDWWEFPVMLKMAPGNGPIAPVFGAGLSVQHISNFGDVPSYLLTGRTSGTSMGFVAGGGVQFRVGALQVTPEVRYTRWTSGNWAQSAVDTLLGGRNQTQFLVGFTF
jgi:hypothetical protein